MKHLLIYKLKRNGVDIKAVQGDSGHSQVDMVTEVYSHIIDEKRLSLSTIEIPPVTKNRLRKNAKKESSYASNKIEGNPLTEKQANEAIESDPHKHFLKPEQEVRNYFLALNLLEEQIKRLLIDV